jgi:hypothetical protein
MKTLVKGAILALALCAPMMLTATSARADEWPMVGGDFWEVTGVSLKDGGSLSYANFLAGEWRENQEFAKSKGWIKGYTVLANNYPRKGEADLYLITISDHITTGSEDDKRQVEYMAWKKKSLDQMQKESGNRAEFRELLGSQLLQELKFRK